jgi:hypothetical protein
VSDFEQDVRGVDGYTMPATQHDLWLWVAGHAYDKVFDVTRYDGSQRGVLFCSIGRGTAQVCLRRGRMNLVLHS